ncbi:galactokinase [Edaphobacter acidisoli]|nr:galactokinase [Edaphobacter acidisoli]
MKTDTEEALRKHEARFGQTAQAFTAPARVNLIGEHTDYTGGLVMPMAIDFHTIATISPRSDGRAVFYSANFNEERSIDIASLSSNTPAGHWSDYPAGVVWSLRQEGIAVGGFNMGLSGNVPPGAGLSSSASIEVAATMALLALQKKSLPLKTVAILCRRTENEYVGAKSGIMDQFIVAGGVAHRAMMLDCRSLEFELLPLPEDERIVICNSMVKHSHASGGYGDRSDEVAAGQDVIRRERGIDLLRDATLIDLESCRDKMSEASFKRCRHIITENARVLEARKALLADDLVRFGKLMFEAHASMRDDFEASCEEVDKLVAIAARQPGCLGARITGGGFGGCTVNLVKSADAESFVEAVRRAYHAETAITADCFVCEASDGALALLKKGLA